MKFENIFYTLLYGTGTIRRMAGSFVWNGGAKR
jgi:hypothetical protein